MPDVKIMIECDYCGVAYTLLYDGEDTPVFCCFCSEYLGDEEFRDKEESEDDTDFDDDEDDYELT